MFHCDFEGQGQRDLLMTASNVGNDYGNLLKKHRHNIIKKIMFIQKMYKNDR